MRHYTPQHMRTHRRCSLRRATGLRHAIAHVPNQDGERSGNRLGQICTITRSMCSRPSPHPDRQVMADGVPCIPRVSVHWCGDRNTIASCPAGRAISQLSSLVSAIAVVSRHAPVPVSTTAQREALVVAHQTSTVATNVQSSPKE